MFADILTLKQKLSFATNFGYVFLAYNVLLFLVNVIVKGVKNIKRAKKIFCTPKAKRPNPKISVH
jgi:hypothetical protein